MSRPSPRRGGRLRHLHHLGHDAVLARRTAATLIVDAPSVVARYFPDYRALYDKRGWTMFASIDRVYDASKARARELGFTCRTGFAEILDSLR